MSRIGFDTVGWVRATVDKILKHRISGLKVGKAQALCTLTLNIVVHDSFKIQNSIPAFSQIHRMDPYQAEQDCTLLIIMYKYEFFGITHLFQTL